MANMSYCRFHNTRLDLSDCLDALYEGEYLSFEESVAGKRMFRDFLIFCRENDIIDGFDEDAVEAMFDTRLEGGEADEYAE